MYLNIEYFYYKIYTFLVEGYKFLLGRENTFKEAFAVFKSVVFVFSLLISFAIVYNIVSLIKSRRTRLVEMAKFIFEEAPPDRRSRWEKIKKYLESDNISDWRWAIMEADSLWEDILKRMGYPGESFADRLSKIKRSQFKNLDNLWKAHKFRNRIAHEGENIELTKDQAEQIIEMYGEALKELEYI